MAKKINYEIIERNCVTQCLNIPTSIKHHTQGFRYDIKIGSMACKKCVFNKGFDDIKKYIFCSYENDNNTDPLQKS